MARKVCQAVKFPEIDGSRARGQSTARKIHGIHSNTAASRGDSDSGYIQNHFVPGDVPVICHAASPQNPGLNEASVYGMLFRDDLSKKDPVSSHWREFSSPTSPSSSIDALSTGDAHRDPSTSIALVDKLQTNVMDPAHVDLQVSIRF
jgi:hypothetical protein